MRRVLGKWSAGCCFTCILRKANDFWVPVVLVSVREFRITPVLRDPAKPGDDEAWQGEMD